MSMTETETSHATRTAEMYRTINFTTSRIRLSAEPFVAFTAPKKMSDPSIYTRSIQASYERGKSGAEAPQSNRFARSVSLDGRGAFGLRCFSTAFEPRQVRPANLCTK